MKIMKHLMRYEGYTTAQRVDDILDKISKYGINSLSRLEKEFLDAHKSGNEDDLHNQLAKEESEKFFEDDAGMFKFEFDSMEDYGDEIHYLGTITCPDLVENGKTINGRIGGKIIYYPETTMTSPEFGIQINGKDFDIFDFCEGYEYELDNFIDYVVQELEKED
jgi:hypothetical protein